MTAYTRGLGVNARNVAGALPSGFQPQDAIGMSTASLGAEAAEGQSGSAGDPDVGQEMVDMVSNERAIQANMAVIRASDKTLGVLLDTVA